MHITGVNSVIPCENGASVYLHQNDVINILSALELLNLRAHETAGSDKLNDEQKLDLLDGILEVEHLVKQFDLLYDTLDDMHRVYHETVGAFHEQS